MLCRPYVMALEIWRWTLLGYLCCWTAWGWSSILIMWSPPSRFTAWQSRTAGREFSQTLTECLGVSLALIAANILALGLEQASVRVWRRRLHIKRPPCRLALTLPDGNTARIVLHVLDGALYNFSSHHKATTHFLFRNEGGGSCCVRLHVSQGCAARLYILFWSVKNVEMNFKMIPLNFTFGSNWYAQIKCRC